MTKTVSPSNADIAAALFNSAEVVDELGLIKAQIAKLEEREKALTDALKATGCDSFAGKFYDATVSRSTRDTLDTKALKAALGDEIVAEYTKSTPVVTLKLTAKK